MQSLGVRGWGQAPGRVTGSPSRCVTVQTALRSRGHAEAVEARKESTVAAQVLESKICYETSGLSCQSVCPTPSTDGGAPRDPELSLRSTGKPRQSLFPVSLLMMKQNCAITSSPPSCSCGRQSDWHLHE